VAAGEFVCLVGPSDCGKSTLLSLIAGLDSPTHGTIRADGRRVSGPGTDRVLLSQDAALFPWLDVQRNVPVHMTPMTRDDVEKMVKGGIERVKQFCADHVAKGDYFPGCPVQVR